MCLESKVVGTDSGDESSLTPAMEKVDDINVVTLKTKESPFKVANVVA